MKLKAEETSTDNRTDFPAPDNAYQVANAEYIEYPDRHSLVAA